MKKAFLLIGLFYSVAAAAQIDWTKSRDWTLYKANDSVMFHANSDSLGSLPNLSLNRDTIAYYLQEAKLLPVGTKGEWMGGFLASCTIAGKVKKILISSYGGFIYDPLSGLFYQLPQELKDQWFAYINGCALKL